MRGDNLGCVGTFAPKATVFNASTQQLHLCLSKNSARIHISKPSENRGEDHDKQSRNVDNVVKTTKCHRKKAEAVLVPALRRNLELQYPII